MKRPKPGGRGRPRSALSRLIEAGAREYPWVRQCRGAMFRRSGGRTTHACALGFAYLHLFGERLPRRPWAEAVCAALSYAVPAPFEPAWLKTRGHYRAFRGPFDAAIALNDKDRMPVAKIVELLRRDGL